MSAAVATSAAERRAVSFTIKNGKHAGQTRSFEAATARKSRAKPKAPAEAVAEKDRERDREAPAAPAAAEPKKRVRTKPAAAAAAASNNVVMEPVIDRTPIEGNQ